VGLSGSGAGRPGLADNGAMSSPDVPLLDVPQLIALGQAARLKARADCPACGSLACPGWEALPGSFDRATLRRVATLRQPDVDEPAYEEYHPAGTQAWSPTAPIAPKYFPYNRCDVARCTVCERAFLRYTEAGGYYVEERIRDLNPDLVVDAALA
jgi:hypothetical protein